MKVESTKRFKDSLISDMLYSLDLHALYNTLLRCALKKEQLNSVNNTKHKYVTEKRIVQIILSGFSLAIFNTNLL